MCVGSMCVWGVRSGGAGTGVEERACCVPTTSAQSLPPPLPPIPTVHITGGTHKQLTVGVPHVRQEAHLGGAVGEIVRELELCFEEAALTEGDVWRGVWGVSASERESSTSATREAATRPAHVQTHNIVPAGPTSITSQ